MMVGKTSIEHILHSHYRAITDVNWHTSEPDTVASVGIDAWVWSWDLREPRKPVLGVSFDRVYMKCNLNCHRTLCVQW